MTDDLVERVARLLCDDVLSRWRSPIALKGEPWREFEEAARAAITACQSEIREGCAKVAEAHSCAEYMPAVEHGKKIAQAIRSMKP